MTKQQIIEEVAMLLAPESLAVEAAVAIYDVVKALVAHESGAEVAARRTAEALAAEAFIRG